MFSILILLSIFTFVHSKDECFGLSGNNIVTECKSCNFIHDYQGSDNSMQDKSNPADEFSMTKEPGSFASNTPVTIPDKSRIKPKPASKSKFKPGKDQPPSNSPVPPLSDDPHQSIPEMSRDDPHQSIPEMSRDKPNPRNKTNPADVPASPRPASNNSFCYNTLSLDNIKVPRQCFCYHEICHVKNLDTKGSEIILNYPTGELAPLSKLTTFNCDWQVNTTTETTLYVIDTLDVPLSTSNITIGKVLLPPNASRKIAVISPSSTPISFTGSLRNANFHAFAHHGFCSSNNGYLELPWDINVFPSGSKLISSHYVKESKRHRPNAFCSWTFTASQSEKKLMSSIFYTSNLTEGNKMTIRSWNWNSNDTDTYHFDQRHPPHLVSADRQLSIIFMSDLEKEGYEFSANVLTDRCSDELVTSLASKGVIFDGSKKESMYEKGLRCKWLISGHHTPSLKKIMLKVNYFNLLGFDYLMVYDVKPLTDEKILIGKYSGHSIPSYFATNHSLYLELVTNYQDMYELNGTDPRAHVDFSDETGDSKKKKNNIQTYGVYLNYTICDLDCQNCKPGTYYNFETSTCALCPDDHFSDEKGTLECNRCPNATYGIDNICIDCDKRHSLNLSKFKWVKHKCESFDPETTFSMYAGYGLLMLFCLAVILGVSMFFLWKKDVKQADSIDIMYEAL